MRQNIDTKEMELELVFNQHGQEMRKYISRGMLTRRNFLELMKYGVDVAEHTVSQILVYLNEREKRAPLKYVHSSVGFGEHDGAPIFKLQTAIGTNSEYIGNLLVEPKGSFSEWARIIRDEVLGHTPLELALVMGLAAPVASLVAKETGLEVIVAHLYGDSTQGKTTATRLAVSPFGCPHTHQGGLIRLWNSTKNAMFASIRDTHGVPIVFDEASMHSGEFSTLIYQIAGGTERARLNKESELREASQWSGVFFSNGEMSLLAKAVKNTGVRVRLTEFGNVNWTRSAANADALKEGLLKNYGHAGPVFVEHLMKVGTEAIVNMWRDWRVRFHEQIARKGQLSQRNADKMAIFLVTAELAKVALGVNFDTESIQKMLLETVENLSGEADLSKNAYNFFMESVTRHNSKFETEHFEGNRTELWGKCESRNGRLQEVIILKEVFNKIMAEGGFEDTSVILNKWRAQGLLNCEAKKHTRKRVLCGRTVRVYVIQVKDDVEDELAWEEQKPKPRKRPVPSSPKASNLFDEN